MSNKINLHVHSTISDGRRTPKEIANYMEENEVIFSLTDHDSIEGIDEVLKHLTNKNLFINGCEVSVNIDLNFPIQMIIHLLVYDFNLEQAKEYFKKIKENNMKIINLILMKLQEKDIKINDYIKSKTDIAKWLVNHGYASTINDAFEEIINKIALNKYQDVKLVIDNFHNMGAKVFLAHPFDILHNVTKIKIKEKEVECLIKYLVSCNLDGIECYYYNYNEEQTKYLVKLSEKYNLLKSSGVDSHFKEYEKVFYQKNLNLIKWVSK